MKNQNYITLALGLVQANGGQFLVLVLSIPVLAVPLHSSLDFESDLFSKFITNSLGAKEPDAAKYWNNPMILPWNKGRSPKANLHRTWYIHHLK